MIGQCDPPTTDEVFIYQFVCCTNKFNDLYKLLHKCRCLVFGRPVFVLALGSQTHTETGAEG